MCSTRSRSIHQRRRQPQSIGAQQTLARVGRLSDLPRRRSKARPSIACATALLIVCGLAQPAWAADPISMTVVAPDWVTDLTRVEARVALRNPSALPASYQVDLFLDSTLGTQRLATENFTVAPGEQQLYSTWFSTAGLAGDAQVRYQATPADGAPLVGQHPMQIVASDTRAVPLITAAWIDPGAVVPGVYPKTRAVTSQDVRDSVDAAHSVGVDTLIITYSEYLLNGWGAFYASPSLPGSPAGFDVVGTVLNQASQNGQRVFVGLGRGDDLLLTWNGFSDAQRNAAALAHGTTMANELWELYSDEPSFYGWYLTHEANEIGPASSSFYNPMVDVLRQFEADKPVVISPAGTPIISNQILDSSNVDVFAYQDAVGSGYVPYVNTFDPQERIDTLDAVFGAYQSTHATVNKHLWANLENWQMDGPVYGNAYPADFSRILQQLEIEKNYVDIISSYEWLGFMEHPDSTVVLGGQRAVDLFVAYRDYYQQVLPTLKTENYVSNPGFEHGATPGGAVPVDWQFTGDGFDQSVTLSIDSPTNSETSVQIDVDQPNALAWLSQDVPVTAGNEYKFSAWAKQLQADPSGGWLAAQVWMLSDSGSGEILDSTAMLYSDQDWDFQSTMITAPADANIARVLLAIQDSSFGAGIGSYLVDGVSLVGPPTADAPGDNADFNSDGVTDQHDLAILESHFGESGVSRAIGDATGDGNVAGADALAWQRQISSNANASNVAAPEPATTLLCLLLAGFCGAKRPMRRRAHEPQRSVVEHLRRAESARWRVLATGVVAAALAMPGAVAQSTTDVATEKTMQPGYGSSMTLIPPTAVSAHVEVEVRVAVRNHTVNDARFEVVLSLNGEGDQSIPLFGTPVEVPAMGQELLKHRIPVGQHIGNNKLHYRITGPDKFEESGSRPLQVVDCPSRAVPLIQIGWLDPGAMIPKAYAQQRPPNEQDLRAAIDAYHAIGIRALIITYPESIYLGHGVFYPSRVYRNDGSRVAFDVVGTILNQASKNGQQVFVGLGRGADLLLTWTGFDDADRQQAALAHSMKTATELWASYSHEPSFYGWYLTHEANDIAQASSAYYNRIANFLRTFEADKPVLISPAGTPIFSTKALAESEVDIFAYQDAVGSGYVPFENTFEPQRRIDMLEGVYREYARVHRDSGKHLWANLEIWQMDGPEYGNSYPPDFERVRKQLEIEQRHVDVITAYTLAGFMDSPKSTVELGGEKAIQLFRDYSNYYRTTAQELGICIVEEQSR